MFLVQHLKAPNDTNGNPRRLYVVYEARNSEWLPENASALIAELREAGGWNAHAHRTAVELAYTLQKAVERPEVSVEGVYDEGYVGRRALPAKFLDAPELSEVNITPAEYKSWLAFGRQLKS